MAAAAAANVDLQNVRRFMIFPLSGFLILCVIGDGLRGVRPHLFDVLEDAVELVEAIVLNDELA